MIMMIMIHDDDHDDDHHHDRDHDCDSLRVLVEKYGPTHSVNLYDCMPLREVHFIIN